MYIYFLVFSSRRNEKKKKKKNEKKNGAGTDWATTQTVSRYNGVLYRDMAHGCVVGWVLYCNKKACWLGNCIARQRVVL